MTSSTSLPSEIASYLGRLEEPFSVYVHIPFCLRKCPYCSFFSVPAAEVSIEKYLDSLKKEILFYRDFIPAAGEAHTLYFGGGTPTLLSPVQWDGLLSFCKANLNISAHAEITAEANPESFTEDHGRVWREKGVTRVSIGVQSFRDDELRLLCRPHDARGAEEAVSRAVGKGFSVGVDLMFGLEGQTLHSWASSVKKALSLGADHLSLYQLTIEEGCEWRASPPTGLADGYPLYRWSQWYLPQKGFIQYEIANFSLPGRSSRHNGAYWSRSPVLGLGAGAWGFLGGVRYKNESDLALYAAFVRERGGGAAEAERVTGEKAAREAAVLMLRRKSGISYREFAGQFGGGVLEEIRDTFRREVPRDCYLEESGSLSLTKKGMRVANAIWSALI